MEFDTTTDDYGNLVYFDDCGEQVRECCVLAEPYTCGDCWGGTDRDPYVNGSASGWYAPSTDTLVSMVGR